MRSTAALFIAPLLLAPAARAAVPLAAHHAEYVLKLDTSPNTASDAGNVVAAHGTMTYDVTDACTAWASDQRLNITLTNHDGQDIQMVSDYATFESKDGLHMEFHMKQLTDTAVTQQVDGAASLSRAGGTGEVHYTMPAAKVVPLPEGTLFPMAHTAAIIAGAEAGKRFLTLPLFDGTGPDGAQDTFVTILDWGKDAAVAKAAATSGDAGAAQPAGASGAPAGSSAQGAAAQPAVPASGAVAPDASGSAGTGATAAQAARTASRPDASRWPALAALPSGRVHISFFDRGKPGSNQTPDYEIGMRYWENGVADGLRMDFGDFVMDGALTQFRLAAPPHC